MKFKWSFAINNKWDRKALDDVLRFCYGKPLRVSIGADCMDDDGALICSVIATLIRLQVNGVNDIVDKLTKHMIEACKRDVNVGVQMLKTCVNYPECCGAKPNNVDEMISNVVLTREHIQKHYKIHHPRHNHWYPQEPYNLYGFHIH